MFLFLLLLALSYTNAHSVVVEVEQGTLKGAILQRSTGNGKYCSFKGIPYAAPPVGDLRFRIDVDTDHYVHGSDEDCLFLNVYTPTVTPKSPLPVMFYIHGGYLNIGSGNTNQHGPDFLLDHDVVLVTINYRLGVLGFLSLDINEAPGNAGLKDQVAALKWVKRNIAKFGGDPDNVTIFGQSSGGSSVTLHLLSPMSKGLFKRAISLSGSLFKDVDLPLEHKRRAFQLTQELGLYTKDPKEAVQFLKAAHVKDLVTTEPFILHSEKPRREMLQLFNFKPIVEIEIKSDGCGSEPHSEPFLTEDPLKLLNENKTNTADLIIGHTTEEGIKRAVPQKKALLKYLPVYREYFLPLPIPYKINTSEVLDFGDRIKEHYFGKKEVSEETFVELIKFYSYTNYVYNIHRFLELWVKTGNKAYFYKFTCFSERNVYGKTGIKYGLRRSTHSDDIPYLFDGSEFHLWLNKQSPSYKMIVQTCTLYTNFAKYGNPTASNCSVTWQDYSQNKSYLDIGEELVPKTAGQQPEIDFWREIFESAGMQFY